jgi:hypothetical protein
MVATTAGVDSTGNVAADEARAARLDGGGRGPSRLSSVVVISSFVSADRTWPRTRRTAPTKLGRMQWTPKKSTTGHRNPAYLIPDCYELRFEGKVMGGFGADLWRIRAVELQYPRCYSSCRYCSHGEG